MAATMPSVAPQVTVISVSGSGSQPGYVRAVLAEIASRSGFAPHVIAYWLTSAKIAAAATGFGGSGPISGWTRPSRDVYTSLAGRLGKVVKNGVITNQVIK